jgi:hypothetical protein
MGVLGSGCLIIADGDVDGLGSIDSLPYPSANAS